MKVGVAGTVVVTLTVVAEVTVVVVTTGILSAFKTVTFVLGGSGLSEPR